ncbi:MAG TPA: hypothetical protein VGC56_14810 [Allosphingosinicella sp.]|jgi:hypothetical protein
MMRRGALTVRAMALGLSLATVAAARAEQASPSPPELQGSGIIDPASVSVPDLTFVPTRDIERSYDQHFYYHREHTDFATAYADLRECDAYARGISLRLTGLGGVTGLVTDAIVGGGQRRDISRRNMRVCMRFKEYRRYGLPEALWKRIALPPGSGGDEAERQRLMLIDAKLASGSRPKVGDLGL